MPTAGPGRTSVRSGLRRRLGNPTDRSHDLRRSLDEAVTAGWATVAAFRHSLDGGAVDPFDQAGGIRPIA